MEKLLSIIVIGMALVIIFLIFKLFKARQKISDYKHRLNIFSCMSRNETFQCVCAYLKKLSSANGLYFHPISKRDDINRYFTEKINSVQDLRRHLQVIEDFVNSKKAVGLRSDISNYLGNKSNLTLGNWYAEVIISLSDFGLSDFIFNVFTQSAFRQAKDMQEFMDTVIFVLNEYKKDKNVNKEAAIDEKIQEFKINIANSRYPVSLK